MTTAQILKLARKKLLESSQEVFTDDDLLLYANITKDELAKRYLGKKLIKKTNLAFVSGLADIPTDWNGHYFSSDTDGNGGNEFKYVNLEDFLQGKYSRMITIEDGKIRVSPASTGSIYMWYTKKLADMALGSVPVNPPTELDDLLHELLVYGIVWRGLEDAQDFELSKYFKDKWEADFEIKSMQISELEEQSQEAGEMFNPLPDLNFTGGYSTDPNRF